MWVTIFFVGGFLVGMAWHDPAVVYYNLRVEKVLPPDSMKLISPETGPFRADFCPSNNIQKYEPRAGYAMCRLKYVDRGCMDISGKDEGFVWVKNADESTATLTETDTWRPYPDCHKIEENADAR